MGRTGHRRAPLPVSPSLSTDWGVRRRRGRATRGSEAGGKRARTGGSWPPGSTPGRQGLRSHTMSPCEGARTNPARTCSPKVGWGSLLPRLQRGKRRFGYAKLTGGLGSACPRCQFKGLALFCLISQSCWTSAESYWHSQRHDHSWPLTEDLAGEVRNANTGIMACRLEEVRGDW